MAAGVTLVGAGLLSYATPGGGSPPTAGTASATVPANDAVTPVPAGPSAAVPSNLPPAPRSEPPSVPPTPSGPTAPAGSSEPSPALVAEATRVVVPSMGIDLPVLSRLDRVRGQGPDRYPPCDVALFHDAFVQPGQEGTTYLYAHAQAGMFLPLLEASQRRNGEALLGALVEVYTEDDRLYLYSIDRVKRHAIDFSLAEAEPGEHKLILQTSEGPFGTFEKLQVAARLISSVEARPEDAHPRPRPRPCYPG